MDQVLEAVAAELGHTAALLDGELPPEVADALDADPAALLAELTRNARTRTPAELVTEIEQRLEAEGSEGFAAASSATLLRADRETH